MIAYDIYGDTDAPILIFLHGAMSTHSFTNQYYLADRFCIVVPHLFGSGEEITTVYTPEAQLVALEKLVISLSSRPKYIIGHSLGAELALALMVRNPKEFSGVVFLSPWVNSTTKYSQLFARLAPVLYLSTRWQWLQKWQLKQWNYSHEQTQFHLDYIRKTTRENCRNFYVNRIHLDDYPEYKQIQLPMLAICGSREFSEIKSSLQEMGRRNPNCKTMVLTGLSHDFPQRKFKELNPIIEEFLANCKDI